MAPQEEKELLVVRDVMVELVHGDQWDLQDHEDLQDPKETKDHPVLLVDKDLLAILEIQAPWV